MIIQDYNEQSDYHFIVLNNEKIINNKILKKGSNKGESLGVMSFNIFENFLWFHDIVIKKIIKLDTSSFLLQEEIFLEELSSNINFWEKNKIIQFGNINNDPKNFKVIDD